MGMSDMEVSGVMSDMEVNGVIKLLANACKEAGSPAILANRLKVRPRIVRAVLQGKRRPTRAILDGLGLEKAFTYHRKR